MLSSAKVLACGDVRSWDEFRAAGLLWFVNRTLQLFGWSLVVVLNDSDRVESVHPIKTNTRGFSEASEERGFTALTHHIADNIDTLLDDVK